MNDIKKDKREFVRIGVKQLTSIIKHEGAYKLIEEVEISTPTLINVKDISTGGLRILSEYELMNGASVRLTIPDINTLDSAIVECEVVRSLLDDDNHTYDIGLRFRPPNTDYLKQLIEFLKMRQAQDTY